MGNGLSHLFPCLTPHSGRANPDPNPFPDPPDPLDEALGHSFCYVRSSNRFLSPPSSRFLSPSSSLRFSPSRPDPKPDPTLFKSISGASVSANTSISKTVLQLDSIYDYAPRANHNSNNNNNNNKLFESSSSFASLPLQPGPGRPGPGEPYFMSGPIERQALSGPLDQNVPFSAPLGLGGIYVKRKKKRGIPGIRKAAFFSRNFSEKKRPWVVPVRNFRKEEEREREERERESDSVQWALGAAGEDRVHVVVSEEHGWLFVGIYDGFNGPDGPEFLMGNLYKSVFNQLEGLFWDNEEANSSSANTEIVLAENDNVGPDRKRVTFQNVENAQNNEIRVRRRRLWEYLAEDDREDGLDLSGSDRYAFSVDDALSVGGAGSRVSRSSLLLSRLKNGLVRRKESGKLFAWRFKEKREGGVEEREREEEEEEERVGRSGRKRRVGPVDHDEVLSAMSRALEATEVAYLDMTDKFLDQNPELALMGSCLLVVLMREEDVYVMNVGDSRAIVAQFPQKEISTNRESKEVVIDEANSGEDIVEEGTRGGEREDVASEGLAQYVRLSALQLSTDHSTSIEEEIIRIQNEHPEDSHCIVNARVKGKLKVTRAFGAGFLKQPKWNDALLEMFRIEYISSSPYLSCSPSLHHHKLCPNDQFLVLSSDGLYQYFSNQEVVAEVENFMERFPDGDPAQHLIEELLLRAAKKAGMDLQELLDIPQGARRDYHDDVTVMIISLEGRIWKSSGKYL